MFLSFLQSPASRLVQFSCLMLFVELMLIRWVGSNIYYLFFFSNFILMASFLGIGMGFLRAKNRASLFGWFPFLLALVVVLCYSFSFEYHAQINPRTGNLDYSGMLFRNHVYPVWISLPLIFILAAALMAAIADAVSRAFQQFPSLQAYRLEVAGSLLGIIIFSLLAFFNAGPLAWGLVICLLCILPLADQWRARRFSSLAWQIAMLAVVMFTFVQEQSTGNHFWSPYYKIELQEFTGKRYVVNVNGLAQQVIESVAQRRQVKPFYFLPYQHAGKKYALNNVLIVGAGTGGDVAIALAQGARHVDAVEIDPTLYRLGKQYNPDQPYRDPRVRVIINDGRAFLRQSQEKYDMIIYALTDSLMLVPGQSSLRLENYLYTLEGLTEAGRHLKADGVFTIYNYYGFDWFINRLAGTLDRIYQHAPCIDKFGDRDYWATVLTISPDGNRLQCPALWVPEAGSSNMPATDNHPFLYLQGNHIPPLYVFTLLFIFIVSLGSLKKTGISYQAIGDHLSLFFMGAAFMLLETKNIVNFALLFGTTWFVNALVFIGILFTVYLSIEVSSRAVLSRQWMLYTGLLASLCLSWFIPNDYLLALPALPRFGAAAMLAFLPVFMANLIFASCFRETRNSTDAFGANLIGAVFGGMLEYISLLTGYQNLLLLVMLLYVLALLSRPRLESIYGLS